MKEADFQRRVMDMAARFGWKVWHVPSPMRATEDGKWVGAKEAAGLPDLVMIHEDPPRLIFAELKGTGGTYSGKQLEFLRAARLVADVTIARDDDHDVYPRAVGVYAWGPEDEPIAEQILRSKILL